MKNKYKKILTILLSVIFIILNIITFKPKVYDAIKLKKGFPFSWYKNTTSSFHPINIKSEHIEQIFFRPIFSKTIILSKVDNKPDPKFISYFPIIGLFNIIIFLLIIFAILKTNNFVKIIKNIFSKHAFLMVFVFNLPITAMIVSVIFFKFSIITLIVGIILLFLVPLWKTCLLGLPNFIVLIIFMIISIMKILK
jgi:hypothetical protein